MKKISILIPCYNEEKSVSLFYNRLINVIDSIQGFEWELIPEMVKEWEKGFDDIFAERISRGKESVLRKNLTKTFYKVLNSNSGIDMMPNVGDFRLLDRKCIEAIKQIRESERYTKGIFSWIGFKKKAVRFDQGDRIAGRSSMSYSKLIKLALNGFIANTTAPLRLATILGFIVSLCAFAYMIFHIYKNTYLRRGG